MSRDTQSPAEGDHRPGEDSANRNAPTIPPRQGWPIREAARLLGVMLPEEASNA